MARLCLDCDEVHDGLQCPVCASEMFAYITRWVPAPERRRAPRPTTSPEAEIYRQLVNEDTQGSSNGRRMLKQGVLGLTAVGLLGLFWKNRQRRPADEPTPPATEGE